MVNLVVWLHMHTPQWKLETTQDSSFFLVYKKTWCLFVIGKKEDKLHPLYRH
jgi:hypothetical protein